MALHTVDAPLEAVTNGRPAPRLTLLQAVRRHLVLALLPVLVLAGVGAAVALVRAPAWSSDAQLNVGGVNLTIQSIPGYSVAVGQLATAYSRAVDAEPVVRSVSRATGVSEAEVRKRVTATPVEGSGVIRVHAETGSAAESERLADATANALTAYATTLNRANPDKGRLLKAFIADSRELRSARTALAAARGAGAKDAAQTRVDLALLQQQTDGALYQQSQAGGATTSLVQKLAPASPAASDQSSMLQRLIAAGALAGALLGAGLAVTRANALSQRRLARR